MFGNPLSEQWICAIAQDSGNFGIAVDLGSGFKVDRVCCEDAPFTCGLLGQILLDTLAWRSRRGSYSSASGGMGRSYAPFLGIAGDALKTNPDRVASSGYEGDGQGCCVAQHVAATSR